MPGDRLTVRPDLAWSLAICGGPPSVSAACGYVCPAFDG